MSFDKLLAELDGLATEAETMRKALPADDGKDDEAIQAAAGEGGAGDDEGQPAGEGEGESDENDAGEDTAPPFGKSMALTDADGNPVEAIDGTELVKSLMGEVAALKAGMGAQEGVVLKSLESTLTLVKSQGELIKSLSDQVKKLGSAGRGRQAVLSVAEKPQGSGQLAKSAPAGMTGREVLAKALDAQRAGKITGLEVSRLENAINAGIAPQAEILSRIQ
jgi:hypothetical protein